MRSLLLLLFFGLTWISSAQEAWEQLNDFPIETRGFKSVILQGKPIVLTRDSGATDYRMNMYDPTLDSWSYVTDVSSFYDAPFVLNDLIYFVRLGSDGTNNVELWEYDLPNDIWTRKNDVTDFFGSFGSSEMHSYVLNGVPYVLLPGNGDANFFRYNEDIDTWTSVAVFPTLLDSVITSFSIGDKAYTVFGSQDLADSVTSLWEYDSVLDMWTQKADFPSYVRTNVAAFVINDLAYIGGGTGVQFPEDSFYRYDPIDNTWTLIEPCGYKTSICFSFALDNKGYVGVGSQHSGGGSYSDQADVWRLDPELLNTDAFAKIGVEIYPNPVQDQLFFNATVPVEKVSLYNLSGQLVSTKQGVSVESISLENLPGGMYFVQLEQGTSVLTYKVMKE